MTPSGVERPRLTERDIANVRREHIPKNTGDGDYCTYCIGDHGAEAWPCPTIRALDELISLRESHTAALAELAELRAVVSSVLAAHELYPVRLGEFMAELDKVFHKQMDKALAESSRA